MKTQLGSVLAKFSSRHNVMTNPRSVWCVLLLGLFFMLKVKGMQYQPQYHPACEQRSQVCGRNTQCSMVGGRPVCSCLPGHHGNPITGCQKGDCEENRDCSNRKSCVNNECVNPCNLQVCGVRAQCDIENHVPVCSCPQRYTGNPFQYCNEIDPKTFCSPSPCGLNANCNVVRDVPTCSCPPGYKGDPLIRCTPECQSDYDCADNQVCSGVRCSPICTEGTCGKNANCLPQNHRAICKCPTGYLGDPLSGCRLECQYNSECPSERSVCSYNRCIDVCKGVCGTNAICEVSGNKAICSCPKNMTGHPFEYCRPFDTKDLCEPNPCGRNAQCQPGYDNTGKDRPVCTCLPGYVGNGVVGCVRGECTSNYDCPDNSVCSSSECVNACSNVCGVGATCEPRKHTAVCACPSGYTGNPTVACDPIPYSKYRAIRF